MLVVLEDFLSEGLVVVVEDDFLLPSLEVEDDFFALLNLSLIFGLGMSPFSFSPSPLLLLV